MSQILSNNFRSFISVSLLRGVGEYFWVHKSAHKIWTEVKSCFLGRVKYNQFKEFSSSFLPPTAWIPGTKYLPAYSNHSNHNFYRNTLSSILDGKNDWQEHRSKFHSVLPLYIAFVDQTKTQNRKSYKPVPPMQRQQGKVEKAHALGSENLVSILVAQFTSCMNCDWDLLSEPISSTMKWG